MGGWVGTLFVVSDIRYHCVRMCVTLHKVHCHSWVVFALLSVYDQSFFFVLDGVDHIHSREGVRVLTCQR